MNTIDARGLSCPQPVLLAKQELDKNAEGCEVIVDNPAARENVSRYAKKAGYDVTITEDNGDILLVIEKMG